MVNHAEVIWTRNFSSLLLSNAFFFGGFHMLLPTIPLLATQMGGTKTQVGLIAGIFVLSSVIIRLFTDFEVRILGKRNCLLIGIAISLVSVVTYLLAPSVEALLWIRVLHGIGFGIGTTFYIAIVSDFIPATRRGEGLGHFGLATTIAMAVAPATGLWVADAYGFSAMFLVATIAELIALLSLAGCSFPSRAPVASHPRLSRSFGDHTTIMDIFVERGTKLPAFLMVLFGIGYGSVLNFIAVYASELHLANPGYFFILGTSCIFLSRLGVGKIYDRKGAAWVILPGAVLFLGGLVMVAETTSTTMFLAASVLYGLGVGMLYPALQAEIINMVPPERRSGASATFSNALDVGLGGGSVLLGLFAERAGLSAAYFAAAAVMIVFLAVYSCHLSLQKGAPGGLPVVEEK
ncbi:MFS transporter [Telmatospirillum sp.]|uniref:MFS transporter n=1 Tax=Telmatospirillum sp. TaxID=2079197 RepID=UPI00283B3423|nr:MFS transporter [Telmatospirillum sp.]MDR3435470.1 MFS transporter [Telmatospirillum sp.]